MMDTDRETGQTKKCTKCGEVKPHNEFYKSKKTKIGIMSHCKECDRMKGASYYAANADKVNARIQANRKADPEKKKMQDRAWYENNKAENYARSVAWRKANPEKFREYVKKYAAKNPHMARERNRKRRQTPIGQLENCIRAGFHRGIRNGGKAGRKTFEILGYTSQALKRHIESQFEPGMSWENYGHGDGCWHIDHIIPLAAHNYESPDDLDFKRAWAMDNLRPMWSTQNLEKGAKLDAPFQPSLALAIPLTANSNTPVDAIRVAC